MSHIRLDILNYAGFRNKYDAFVRMGRASNYFSDAHDLRFSKLLGVGGDDGFKLYPNFGKYVLLTAWDNSDQCKLGRQNSRMFELFKDAESVSSYQLSCYKTHGTWDGIKPFVVCSEIDQSEQPILILTRARVRLKKVPDFIKYTRSSSAGIQTASGNIWSYGIGEYPIIQQATISLWESEQAVMNYAYKSSAHIEVMQRSRQNKWYSEELFARFVATPID